MPFFSPSATVVVDGPRAELPAFQLRACVVEELRHPEEQFQRSAIVIARGESALSSSLPHISFPLFDGFPSCMAFDPSGDYLFVAFPDWRLVLFCLHSQAEEASLEIPVADPYSSQPCSISVLAMSPVPSLPSEAGIAQPLPLVLISSTQGHVVSTIGCLAAIYATGLGVARPHLPITSQFLPPVTVIQALTDATVRPHSLVPTVRTARAVHIIAEQAAIVSRATALAAREWKAATADVFSLFADLPTLLGDPAPATGHTALNSTALAAVEDLLLGVWPSEPAVAAAYNEFLTKLPMRFVTKLTRRCTARLQTALTSIVDARCSCLRLLDAGESLTTAARALAELSPEVCLLTAAGVSLALSPATGLDQLTALTADVTGSSATVRAACLATFRSLTFCLAVLINVAAGMQAALAAVGRTVATLTSPPPQPTNASPDNTLGQASTVLGVIGCPAIPPRQATTASALTWLKSSGHESLLRRTLWSQPTPMEIALAKRKGQCLTVTGSPGFAGLDCLCCGEHAEAPLPLPVACANLERAITSLRAVLMGQKG
jgi:hypothetical protein